MTITYITSLVLALASKEPMKTQIMDMITQAKENGAKMATNLTPTATMMLSVMTMTVP